MRCLRYALTIIFLIGFIGFSTETSSQQRRKNRISNDLIPASLRASLDQRLKQFVQAQSAGRWDEVGLLIGPYRRTGRERELFTASHKECFLSQLRSSAMVEFNLERIEFSTEILSTPVGRRWWYLKGTAEFQRPTGRVKGLIHLLAYLYQGEWYFTPPRNDEVLIKAKLVEEKVPDDLSKELLIELAPTCPLEMVDIRVETDAKRPLFRNFSFALKNKTNKTVTGYDYRFGVPGSLCSTMLAGEHVKIAPGATSERQTDVVYAPYGSYCAGKFRHSFTIRSVDFEKGNGWYDPRFRPGHRPRNCLF